MGKRLSDLLIGSDRSIEKKNMAWNIAGSFVYAFASILLSFLVMRISGDEIGGIFAFGYSTFGQQMFTVAYYGIRPFQITDGRGEYSFGDYLGHRILTCALAVLTAFFYLLWTIGTGAYTVQKGLAVFLLALYKVIDGFADVYESEFQRRGRLYLTGKSNTFRTVLSVCAFTGALLAARGRLNGEDGLLAACLAAAAAQLLGVALFNFSVITRLPGVVWKRERGQIKRLFGQTSLLFVSVFLDFYIFSAAKYAIDANLTDADSGYFNLIFMPTSVIYLVANFVIRPFLTRLTALWTEANFSGFSRLLQKIAAMITALTVLAVGAAVILGKWALGIMEIILGRGYAGSLTRHHGAFTLIILGGGLYAMGNLMYYALVIMRCQKRIFAVYVLVTAAAFILAPAMVNRWQLIGAAGAYLCFMAFLMLGFTLQGIWAYWKEKRKTR